MDVLSEIPIKKNIDSEETRDKNLVFSRLPVVLATTREIELRGLFQIDGVDLTSGIRVLVKDQSCKSQNGIYESSKGQWLRSLDAVKWEQVRNISVIVSLGEVNAGTGWLCTSQSIGEVGKSPIDFIQFCGFI